jgi:hypothetical protein
MASIQLRQFDAIQADYRMKPIPPGAKKLLAPQNSKVDHCLASP